MIAAMDKTADARPALPAPGVVRLHQLAWRPGAFMHDEWWETLGLAGWRVPYRTLPACRRPVDAAICSRRGFPSGALPGRLDANASRLMLLEPRLPSLCVALGLIALDCQEHLLLRGYRDLLYPLLGAHGCEQLLALGTGRANNRGEPVPPAQLVSRACAAGKRWIGRGRDRCPVWQALLVTMAPLDADAPLHDAAAALPAASGDALPMLCRLERFL